MDDSPEGDMFDFLPDDVKPYVVGHFEMIRQENRDLISLLEGSTAATTKTVGSKRLEERLKQLSKDLEREKSKSKSLMKKLKDSQDRQRNSNGKPLICGQFLKKMN